MAKNEKLLVVVDMQKDFIDGALGTSEALGIVPKVVEIVKQAIDAEDIDVVFTRDTHYDNYLDTQEGKKLPVSHCIFGSDGWQICKELEEYTEGKKVFNKPTFGSVTLMDYVINKDYKEATLVGLCTDICVISNAMLIKTALPEIPVKVVACACAGVTPESHENALSAMKMCQIEVI